MLLLLKYILLKHVLINTEPLKLVLIEELYSDTKIFFLKLSPDAGILAKA